uniref:Glucosylceramidase n=1 Tax=Aceria tosichella TaxID=561515 RepID=A0A6G1SJP1_9ACAR
MPRLSPVQGVAVILTILTAVMCQQFVTTHAASAATATELPNDCIMINKDPSKIVCVCNEQKCDDLTFDWPTVSGQTYLVETTKHGQRFATTRLADAVIHDSNNSLTPESSSGKSVISVNLDDQQQEVLGWGGAFTDAATINIQSLSRELSERLIESYFGLNGLQYNMGRVPIGGSDFSTRAYSYDDSSEPDLNLTKWSLADEDLTYKIPTIKRAIEVAGSTMGTQLKLFASPWSPPIWMKANRSFKRGHLIDKDEIYQSYANYLVKFYEHYRNHGVEFWGATVQNEPMSAYYPFYFFNSLQMSTPEMIKFIGHFLGPALESFGYTKQNFKLMIGDDSLGFINYQVPHAMENELVQKYISGMAFHWYVSGLLVPYDTLTTIVNKIEDKIEFVMMSEACEGAFMSFKHVDLGNWQRGEAYASDIIEDFRRKTGAWIDWNLALDLKGGPNWAGNYVDSPIIVDKSKNEFYKQPMYYVLGHFSRFMRPGSTVVGSSISHVSGLSVIAAHVKSTGHLVVNLLNKSNNERRVPLEVYQANKKLLSVDRVELKGNSMSTIIIKL